MWKGMLAVCSLGILSALLSCSSRELQPVISRSSQDLPPEVVARVNGEPITLAELDCLLTTSGSASGDQALRQAVLQELVIERMVRQSAMKYGLTVSEGELDQAVRRQMDKMSSAAFPTCEGCAKTISAAEFREDQRYPLLEAKVFAHYAGQGALKDDQVTESAIRAYYDAHRNRCRGTYAEHHDKIAALLTEEKRSVDREQLIRFLFQRSEILPKSLAVVD